MGSVMEEIARGNPDDEGEELDIRDPFEENLEESTKDGVVQLRKNKISKGLISIEDIHNSPKVGPSQKYYSKKVIKKSR